MTISKPSHALLLLLLLLPGLETNAVTFVIPGSGFCGGGGVTPAALHVTTVASQGEDGASCIVTGGADPKMSDTPRLFGSNVTFAYV